jgi:DNA-directed RNA polymerase specialized sigma24 family protein
VRAELAGQRPLLERAAAGDREAFARIYDDQVEGVHRYLLAWTGDRIEAADLTTQVFHSAIGWLPTTPGPEGEAAAWLIAMSRDALALRVGRVDRGSAGPAGDVVAAVGRLGEPEREVVVLRLLLGHSLDHTAHLSGYSRRAVLELQLAACLAIHELTGGTRAGTAWPETRPAPSAEEFEHRLGRWEIDLTSGDPALADALAVAGSLRQAIPGYLVAPTAEFVEHLRTELVTGTAGSRIAGTAQGAVDTRGHQPLEPATFPHRGPQHPEVAGSRAPTRSEGSEVAGSDAAVLSGRMGTASSGAPRLGGRVGSSFRGGTAIWGWLGRRPWVATGVATAGIVLVLALQAFGGEGGPRACDGRPCPASTTAAVAAGDGSGVGNPLTTVVKSTSTSSTLGGDVVGGSPTVAPPTSAATVPPTTRPATTAAPTTSASRPTTTTRAPTTTVPTTTLPTTTTTAAPAPT